MLLLYFEQDYKLLFEVVGVISVPLPVLISAGTDLLYLFMFFLSLRSHYVIVVFCGCFCFCGFIVLFMCRSDERKAAVQIAYRIKRKKPLRVKVN